MALNNKRALIGMTLQELETALAGIEMPKFAVREIALWIYQKGAVSFDQMTNISKAVRTKLSEHFSIGHVPYSKVSVSADGTKKYLFPAGKQNQFIEAAYIPDQKRNTLCVSSQVGCKLGCLFCMTARQGFQAQLSPAEILNQVLSLPERESLTNLVFMGMGEPFDNTDNVLKALEILTADFGLEFNPKKITVSTVGLIPGMKKFIEESNCHLAISLHTPFDEERASLMPVQTIYPVQQVVDTIKTYDFGKQRRLSFEYIVFDGLNHSDAHVKQMARLFNGLSCRVNLMRFHPIPDAPLKKTSEKVLVDFRNKLNNKGITATIRASRGEDILAACGLLSTRELVKRNNKSA